MSEHYIGFIHTLPGGWVVSALVVDGITTVRLTHEALAPEIFESIFPGYLLFDLVDRLTFSPVVYHEGIDALPLVCFHDQQCDEPDYVWEPRLNRLYCAGHDEYLGSP